MYEQNGSINKEIENLKRNQEEMQGLRSTITEMKNSLEGFKGRFKQAEEKNQQLEDKTIVIIKSQEQKEKRLKKSVECKRPLGNCQVEQHTHCGSNSRRETERSRETI